MAVFAKMKAIREFLGKYFILALACGLATGVAAYGYGALREDPYATTYAVLFALAGMVMIYAIKAMTSRY